MKERPVIGSRFSAQRGQANDAANSRLRTFVRCAIMALSRSFHLSKSPLNHPSGDPPVTAAASDPQIVPHPLAVAPALRAADRGVAEALESVLSDNTRRVYGTQWRIFTAWCSEVGLTSLPAEPLTVARYLAARANSGASIATLRLATSAISKTHEWAKLESSCRDPGVRASLKGWSRRLSKPQRQSGALTADVLASSASPPSSPASAAAASRRLIRLQKGGSLTSPWWQYCPTRDCAGPRRPR